MVWNGNVEFELKQTHIFFLIPIIKLFALDSTRGKLIVCTTSTDLKESKFKIETSDLNICTHLICIDNIWDKSIGKCSKNS